MLREEDGTDIPCCAGVSATVKVSSPSSSVSARIGTRISATSVLAAIVSMPSIAA